MKNLSFFTNVILSIRASLFWIGFAITTLLCGLVCPILFLFPRDSRYKILLPWTYINVWWLRITCGVTYKIIGKENLPKDSNGIILANHQSTWETLFIPNLINKPLSWVLKKELFKIPFFGWALSMINPIAIDRDETSSAMDQVIAKGKERLDEGNWICIFPEGTRVHPDKMKPFKAGGAVLAEHTGYPVYPVAHNAGECWPRMSFFKYPGEITVVVGERIETEGVIANDIIKHVQTWVNKEKLKMTPARSEKYQ